MDRVAIRHPERLAEVLHGRNIRHMFFGHLHRAIAGSWHGIPISVLRATIAQVALFLNSDEVGRSYEDPQYAVVLVEPKQVIVHFHDFLSHEVVAPGDRPPVVGDDEQVAYDHQERINATYSPIRETETGQFRLRDTGDHKS